MYLSVILRQTSPEDDGDDEEEEDEGGAHDTITSLAGVKMLQGRAKSRARPLAMSCHKLHDLYTLFR